MRLRPFSGLAGRIVILIGALGLVLGALLVYGFVRSSRFEMEDAEVLYCRHAEYLSSQLAGDLGAVSAAANGAARFVEIANPDEAGLRHLLMSVVEGNDRIFGSAAAYEPYAFSKRMKAFAPYFCKANSRLRFVQLGEGDYNFFEKDWYAEPKKTGHAVWTEPYFDKGGGDVLMATYSKPFFSTDVDGNRRFRGVVTADVSVDQLTRRLRSFRPEGKGFCFLVSRKGAFLVPPPRGYRPGMSAAEMNRTPRERQVAQVVGEMLSRPSGFLHVDAFGSDESSYLAFARVPAAGWALGVAAPKDEILKHVVAVSRTQAVVTGLILVTALVLALASAHSITRPLRDMVTATARIARGELDTDLPSADTGDEIGALANAFRRMTVDLKRHIHDLTEAVAETERIESELAVAAQIQRSMLPSTYPAFPERDDFRVFAVMETAKTVGGDFYNFFLIDEAHLCVAVGDVSDKGVPAALFMAVVTYLIHSEADRGAAPDEILRSINHQICRGNNTCTFVTAFCGIVDLRNGKFTFSNAGHEAPFILEPEGRVQELRVPRAPALGLIENAVFAGETRFLSPGQTVIVYTDGVTEAFNEQAEMYSDDRLRRTLQSLESTEPETAVKTVFEDVGRFRGGAERNDDITMLAFEVRGK